MKHIEYKVKVWADGAKQWFLNGKYHREDGPAIEYTDGTKYWFLISFVKIIKGVKTFLLDLLQDSIQTMTQSL